MFAVRSGALALLVKGQTPLSQIHNKSTKWSLGVSDLLRDCATMSPTFYRRCLDLLLKHIAEDFSEVFFLVRIAAGNVVGFSG